MATEDKALRSLVKALRVLAGELENPELPANSMLTLLQVMLASEIPMSELEKLTGVSQAAVSRTITRLASGAAPTFDGARVLEAYENPYYRKRKLVKLTPRGETLKAALVEALRGN